MLHTQQSWKRIVGLVLASALFGFLAYAIIVNYVTYKSTSLRLENAMSALSTNPLILYGTVLSVDTGTGVVTIRIIDAYLTNLETRDLQIVTTTNTIVLREELSVGPGGVIVGVSSLSSESLSDVLPGTHVRIYYVRSGESLQAQAIVYGNPL
ncbi:hypothetical protein A2680_03965 [Candidatus Kaiserbacteria bacterium RIFCSPHIGHO2_01_FULL_55_37]|nr:MAG: hypothetical protein A2680_03965 [Candidatus Kaiserbacteria bacterium RIFCSPHIGHO2_01_FULL_55_37]